MAGMSTAGGAYTPTMAEEHIMVHKIANVYLGGPPLVKAALGESITGEGVCVLPFPTKKSWPKIPSMPHIICPKMRYCTKNCLLKDEKTFSELGGATLHCTQSGVADHFAHNEEESFEILRDVISSLNLDDVTPPSCDVEDPLFDPSELDYFGGKDGGALTRQEVHQVLGRILDGSRFQEFKARFGPSLVCGFGFLHGQMVGVVVNIGSALDVAEGQKGGEIKFNPPKGINSMLVYLFLLLQPISSSCATPETSPSCFCPTRVTQKLLVAFKTLWR